MTVTNLGILRLLAYLEGISFILLLGIGMPLKYFYATPEPNLVLGMFHGLLFMAYWTWVILVRSEKKWSGLKTFWAMLAAVLPFGTFAADAKLFREQ